MATFTQNLGPTTPHVDISAAALEPQNLNRITDPENEDDAKATVITPPVSLNTNATLSTPPTSPDSLDHVALSTPPPRDTPKSTPPSKHRSTPLYRRFLHEVKMSPATPPHSPTREKHSPDKGRDSPSKGRASPSKRCKSPTKQKLEVGVNGFHFVCELPMSKVTPKKTTASGTPKNVDGTPTTKTPIPVKMEAMPLCVNSSKKSQGKQTPVKAALGSPLRKAGTPKQSRTAGSSRSAVRGSAQKTVPARALFGTPSRGAVASTPKKSTPARPAFCTPLRNVATPDPAKHASSAKVSPTKSIKMASKYVKGLPIEGGATPSAPPKVLKDRADEEATTGEHDSHATVGSFGTFIKPSPHKPSPEAQRPKPAKERSFDIGGLMANFQALKKQGGSTAPSKYVGETDASEPPTPLKRAARGLQVAPVIRYTSKENNSAAAKEAVTKSTSEPTPADVAEGCLAQGSTSASPVPQKAEEESQTTTPTTVGNADQSANTALKAAQSPFESSSPVLKPCISFTPRAEHPSMQYPPLLFPPSEPISECSSSPSPLSAKKHVQFKDQDPFCSPEKRLSKTPSRNGTDPTVMLAMYKEMDSLKQSLSSSLGVPYTFPSYGQANDFELPIMGNSLEADQATRARRTLERTTSDVSNTSNSTASSMSTVRASMIMNPKAPNATPKTDRKAKWPINGATSAQTRRQELGVVKKDAKQTRMIGATGSHPSPAQTRKPADGEQAKLRPLSKKSDTPSGLRAAPPKPSVASMKRPIKPFAGGIQRSARKSVFDSRESVEQSKRPSSARKVGATPSALKPPRPARTEPRPQEKRFASAMDIADRVAEWHNEDTKKAAAKAQSHVNEVEKKTPSKAKTPTKKSFTPKGSPAKPASSNTIPNKPTAMTPKRPAPKAPAVKTPAHRLLPKPAPRTPTIRQIMDPNAFRTPSKSIESSLDKAIDRKIAEDRRGGL